MIVTTKYSPITFLPRVRARIDLFVILQLKFKDDRTFSSNFVGCSMSIGYFNV